MVGNWILLSFRFRSDTLLLGPLGLHNDSRGLGYFLRRRRGCHRRGGSESPSRRRFARDFGLTSPYLQLCSFTYRPPQWSHLVGVRCDLRRDLLACQRVIAWPRAPLLIGQRKQNAQHCGDKRGSP